MEDNDSRLQRDILLSSTMLVRILTNLGHNLTSFATALLASFPSPSVMEEAQEVRHVQFTIDRIFLHMPETETSHPRFVRCYEGLSVVDMVLLGNCATTREKGVDIDGRIEFIPTHPGLRFTSRETPMHGLVQAIYGSQTWTADAYLQQLCRPSLSPQASHDIWISFGVRASLDVRDEYLALEEMATAVRNRYLADVRKVKAITREKLLITSSQLDEEMKLHNEGECRICCEPVAVGTCVSVLQCGHWYCKPCIDPWLVRNTTCPTCRQGGSSSDDDMDTYPFEL